MIEALVGAVCGLILGVVGTMVWVTWCFRDLYR